MVTHSLHCAGKRRTWIFPAAGEGSVCCICPCVHVYKIKVIKAEAQLIAAGVCEAVVVDRLRS